ncbi:hypothetical protein F2P56_010880 [Juglans regia]|uniref:Uncharacterized protein LOC109020172 n=2 Tax=Juglans regia TaxID=51240 RepID=A0A2I4HPQ4_JUGRE|nr:uncharacterized protein LOC109020172 [Juglans regia]KAF5470361.1 hypothetical protein F2P56_010880 [Juglans regia]
MGFNGSIFTWSNKREGREFTKERLDRFLGNDSWSLLFEDYFIKVLPVISSDHAPLFISFGMKEGQDFLKKKVFRYENYWSKQQECRNIVTMAWRGALVENGKMGKIRESLSHCKHQLREWTKNLRGSFKKQLDLKRNLIQEEFNTGALNEDIKVLQQEVERILELEDLKWKQRAKQKWLKDGNRNSSFFHKCATQRKQSNAIKKLFDEIGIWARK